MGIQYWLWCGCADNLAVLCIRRSRCPFSVVTPSAYAEEMYCLLILFRLYLAGIAFCAFCRKMECGRAASLCGAFAYAFCSFSIYAAVRHPYFASPMIYLPLILLGAEKILRKEKPMFYVAMIFVAAISNFYFFICWFFLQFCMWHFDSFLFIRNRYGRISG